MHMQFTTFVAATRASAPELIDFLVAEHEAQLTVYSKWNRFKIALQTTIINYFVHWLE